MNMLCVAIALAAAFAAILAIYCVPIAISRRRAAKQGVDIPVSAFGMAFPIAAGLLLLVSLGMLAANIARYSRYGAFYDDSWRDPEIESHFIFDTDDSKALEAIRSSDPDAFDPDLYDVILIRLGCADCEAASGDISALKAAIEAARPEPVYIVFSRSPIGKYYVDHYSIKEVPCIVMNGAVTGMSESSAS